MTSRRLLGDAPQPIDQHIPQDYNNYMSELLSRNNNSEEKTGQTESDLKKPRPVKKNTLEALQLSSNSDSESLSEEVRDDIASLNSGKNGDYSKNITMNKSLSAQPVVKTSLA